MYKMENIHNPQFYPCIKWKIYTDNLIQRLKRLIRITRYLREATSIGAASTSTLFQCDKKVVSEPADNGGGENYDEGA